MDGYGRPPEPWERRNPSSWDREPFQRDWYDRERGIQPNEWEEHAGAPIETWDKRGPPRDVGLAPAPEQQWERGRMIEYDQGDGQWEMEDRPPGREMLRRDERFGAERERQGGRDPYYDRERGGERERMREAELGRSRRSHSSERSRPRNRDYESRREYRRRSRSRSRSRSRERRRERDDERRRRNTAEPEPSTIIMMRNLRSSVTEDDISKVLGDKCNLLREVRLIRDRGGTSKGFAFLEFYRLEDARMWLEENRNDFYLQGGLVSLEYSRQRFHDRDRGGREDWTCFKCNTRNFRNIYCSTCECSRHESESLSDERGRDPAKSLERESNPPSQNDGAPYAFQRVAPPPIGTAVPSDHVPNIRFPSIPVELVQRIRSGSFVDASELLPELFEVDAYQREGREGDRNLSGMNTPLDWAVSFATYGALLCSTDPSRGHDLFAYMGIVLQMARSLPRDEWLRYDRAFRQMTVMNPSLPWSEVDYPLWLSIVQPDASMLQSEGSQELAEAIGRERSPTPPPLMAIPMEADVLPLAHTSPRVNPNSRWFAPSPSVEREGRSQYSSQDWDYTTALPTGRNGFEEDMRHSLEDKQVCQRWNEARCDDFGCRLLHLCGVCNSGQHRGRDCPEKHHEVPHTLASAPSHFQNQNQQVCRNWNAERCFFRDCKFLHACSHCKSSDHRGLDCPTIVEPTSSPATTQNICRNWNAEKCFFRDCKFLHACSHCKSSDHRGLDCPTIVEPTPSPATTQNICRNWNAEKCFFRDCKFQHVCIHCKSGDHRGLDCPTTATKTTAPATTQNICRNWNAERCFIRNCRFQHVCVHCKSGDHRGPNCPAIVKVTTSPVTTESICRSWNAEICFIRDCKFQHLCIHCKSGDHRGPNCPTIVNPPNNAPKSTPPRNVLPRSAPPSNAPARNAPPSNAPPRNAPSLSNAPPRSAPLSNAPPRNAPPSNAPLKSALPSNAPLRSAPPSNALLRSAPPSNAPLRNVLSMDSLVGIALEYKESPTDDTPPQNVPARSALPGGAQAREGMSGGQAVCRMWNNGWCFVKGCRYLHVCSVCRAVTHTARNCRTVTAATNESIEPTKDSDVCRKWNIKSCVGGAECKKLHVCLLCKTSDHSALNCPRLGEGKSGHAPIQGQPTQHVCRNWNYKHCIVKDCQYQHVCMLCRSSSHPASLCSQLGEGDESEGSRDANAQCCRDWNTSKCVFKDCRFRHACFHCRSITHKAPNCPYAQ